MIHETLNDAGITIVRPGTERLTASNAKTFKDEMVNLIEGGASEIIVDFDGVTFVDSSGLGALVGVLKKIGVRGELSVSGLSSEVSQTFKICRMDRVFTIYRNTDEAIQKIQERS